MKKLKLYIETSAWNFYYADDAPEKMEITKLFFQSVKSNEFEIFISSVVLKEINRADEKKKNMLIDLIKECNPVELEVSKEIEDLADEYMLRKIVPEKKRDDALHVATASVYEMDAVITWNFSHMANLRKNEIFNGVNLEMGYTKRIELITPMGVTKNED